MRLIDADVLEPHEQMEPMGNGMYEYVEVVYKDDIDATPTIEAVEVVRCKDCKHRYISGNGTTRYYVCDFMNAQYEDNGFCHHNKGCDTE